MSVLYLLSLLFLLFQDYKTVKSIIYWIDPGLREFHIDHEKEYGVNCSDITLEKIWYHLDVFALAHFLGWLFKAILIRHLGILWAISVMWEITEVGMITYPHPLLPHKRVPCRAAGGVPKINLQLEEAWRNGKDKIFFLKLHQYFVKFVGAKCCRLCFLILFPNFIFFTIYLP